MGIGKVFSDSLKGTLQDTWKEVVVPENFEEFSVLVPGVIQNRKNNNSASNVLSKGSKIQIPDQTAALIIHDYHVERVILEPGTFVFEDGVGGIFEVIEKDQKILNSIMDQIIDRYQYGGELSDQYRVYYINLREIPNLKFGTRGPTLYFDEYYQEDLELYFYGNYSVKIVDPERFYQSFISHNIQSFALNSKNIKQQLANDLVQSIIMAISQLSTRFRISQIQTQSSQIQECIQNGTNFASIWESKYGLALRSLTIENLEMSENSVDRIEKAKMKKKSHSIIKENKQHSSLTIQEQIDLLNQLKQMVDLGILTIEEFDIKKKEIMNL